MGFQGLRLLYASGIGLYFQTSKGKTWWNKSQVKQRKIIKDCKRPVEKAIKQKTQNKGVFNISFWIKFEVQNRDWQFRFMKLNNM